MLKMNYLKIIMMILNSEILGLLPPRSRMRYFYTTFFLKVLDYPIGHQTEIRNVNYCEGRDKDMMIFMSL